MKRKTMAIISLMFSLIIFGVGTIRILFELLLSMPMYTAYIFVFTGVVGSSANIVGLKRLQTDQANE